MSTETHETQENEQQPVSENTLIGISMIGGLGITLAIVAVAIGVVLPDAPSDIIGLTVAVGFGLLITSIAGWALVVRPHENFDDINVPMYHGHHHDDHDDAHGESDDSH